MAEEVPLAVGAVIARLANRLAAVVGARRERHHDDDTRGECRPAARAAAEPSWWPSSRPRVLVTRLGILNGMKFVHDWTLFGPPAPRVPQTG